MPLTLSRVQGSCSAYPQDKRTSLSHLRVPKVHDLIQQLVYEHKVVLYALLAELAAKVRLEEGHHLYRAKSTSALQALKQDTRASQQPASCW